MTWTDRDQVAALIDYDPNTGALTWKRRPLEAFSCLRECNRWNNRYAGTPALASYKKGYLSGTLLGRFAFAHRIAWLIHHGEWPLGEIDHINGDRADNRASNLRVVSSQGNNRNRKTPNNSTTGIMGVYRDTEQPHKWRAAISMRGRTQIIGRFDKIEDAIAARKAAEDRLGFHPNHGRIA